MNTPRHRILGLSAFVAVLGLVLWPGCVTPTITTQRQPTTSLRNADVRAMRREPPTRAEVVRSAGEPEAYFEDLRVAVYRLSKVRRHKLVLLFGVLPILAYGVGEDAEFLLLAYDEDGKVSRLDVRFAYDRPEATRHLAETWLRGPPGSTR